MTIYIIENDVEKLYTAIFDCWNKSNFTLVNKQDEVILGDQIINIAPDEEKCSRVLKKIFKLDKNVVKDICLLLRNNINNTPQIIFNYVKILVSYSKSIKQLKHLKEVIEFDAVKHKILREIDRMYGFLRFMVTEEGYFYAPYSPDNDITSLIAPFFARRLANESFVIHDIKRKKACFYTNGTIIMRNIDETVITLSHSEIDFQSLWKEYYKSVTIDERLNQRQMLLYMPRRYWKFLPEIE